MATDDHSNNREPPTNHTDDDWEAQRTNFHQCYIQDKLSLKDATSFMSKQFGFHATRRQWERKANQWKMFKYERPAIRYKQLEAGESGDRNLSRFLRRHRSPSPHPVRQPSKSRSVNKPRSKSTSAIDGLGHEYGGSAYLAAPDSHFASQTLDFTDPFANLTVSQPYDSNDAMLDDMTYNISISDEVYQEISSENRPDHFKLDATLADAAHDSPVQLHVGVGAAPEVHLTMYDDFSAQLLPPVQLSMDHHIAMPPQYEHTLQPSWTGPFSQLELNREGYNPSQSEEPLPAQTPNGAPEFANDISSYAHINNAAAPQKLDVAFMQQSRQTTEQAKHTGFSDDDDDDDVLQALSPHRLDSDFMLRVRDYTKSIRAVVKDFAKASIESSEAEKLRGKINEASLSFSGDMKIRLENLDNQRQRLIQFDRTKIAQLRQTVVMREQTIAEQSQTLAQQSQMVAQQSQTIEAYERIMRENRVYQHALYLQK